MRDAEQRKDAVLLGHRASCRSCRRGQHVDREALVSAFPVGAFFAQYRLGIRVDRSAAYLTDS